MRKPTKKKRRKRRKKNQKKKKNQKNYANYQNSYSAPAFECWECLSANSFDDCRNRGRMVQCDGGSIGCDITVRSRRMNRYRDWYIEKVQMGCKQMQSCQTEHKFNFGYHPQVNSRSNRPLLQLWFSSASLKTQHGLLCCSGIILLAGNAVELPNVTLTGSKTSQTRLKSGTRQMLILLLPTPTTPPTMAHTMGATTMARHLLMKL